MLANLSNAAIFQKLCNWLERVVDGLFIDDINFSQPMPSDYVAIKAFVKSDPLLVN